MLNAAHAAGEKAGKSAGFDAGKEASAGTVCCVLWW